MLLNITADLIKKSFKLFIKYYRWFLLLSLGFSCSSPQSKVQRAAKFDKLIDSANRLFDAGKPEIAVQHLDSNFKKYKDLSPLQLFNYYNINCNFYYHKKMKKTKPCCMQTVC